MASPDAFEPIEDYIRAQWEILHPGNTIPLVFENEQFPPPGEPTAWVFVEVYGNTLSQESIGGGADVDDNLWREYGSLWMHVMIVRGSGTRTARTYAKELARLFKSKQLGAIRFRDASIGGSEPGLEDGNYKRMSVSVDWELDE